MTDVLTAVDQATPGWLTTILRREGALEHGEVAAVAQESVPSSSCVARLTLRYSPETVGDPPAHLLLKVANPELERRMPQRNLREIQFYTAVVPLAADLDLPVVRCYDAAYRRAEVDQFHLILAAPSRTTHHSFSLSAVPPTAPQSETVVDTLARVHAGCWDHSQLASAFGERPVAEWQTGLATESFARWVGETVPRFLDDLHDRISSARTTMYRRIAARLPARLLERQARCRHLTLTHGDVHLGNFLFPRNPATDRVYVLDWKRASLGLGASDLAYMMALSWFPDVRAEREWALLERYHRNLVERGVTGYVWTDLRDDYRLSVLKELFEPVWGWSVRQNSFLWWNHLERITRAIEDLHCIDVL